MGGLRLPRRWVYLSGEPFGPFPVWARFLICSQTGKATRPQSGVEKAGFLRAAVGTGYHQVTALLSHLLQVEQLFALTPMDPAGNIDYKSLCYIITHGDEKEE